MAEAIAGHRDAQATRARREEFEVEPLEDLAPLENLEPLQDLPIAFGHVAVPSS